MPSYLQIDDDPTRWWVSDTIDASQLTGGKPLIVAVGAPLSGTLVISPKAASVSIFGTSSPPPGDINAPSAATIYVPTATGANAQHAGYELAANAPGDLAQQIATAMGDGHSQTVTLAGGGTLVLSGETLSFVVIKPAAAVVPVGPDAGEGSPHDTP